MTSKIEQQVMASVGVIYSARQLVGATALKLYVCALSLYGIAKLVWVARVWENFSAVGWGNAFSFASSALLHTHLPVQLAFAVFVLAGVWFAVDIIRSLSAPRYTFA